MKLRIAELAIIFILGWALRFGLMVYRLTVLDSTPLENSPQAVEYHNLGRALLYRWEWSNYYFAARPPLMPLLIAGLYAIFGEAPIAVALVNITLSAATAVVAVGVASRLTTDRWVARLAGLWAAIDPASVANSINLQAETLANFCLALAMLWLAATVQHRRLRDAALAGLWLALATLARPTTIYLFIFCLPLFVLLIKPWPRLYLAFAALPVLFILLWSARNLNYMGEFTYSSLSDFNLLFYRAVSVERWANGGKSDDVIRREFAAEVERRLGTPVDPSLVDAGFFWRNIAPEDGRRVKIMRAMALEVFQAHPVWYFATIPVGLYHMYAYTEMYGSPFLPELIFNLLFYAAAVSGVVISWRRRWWLALLLPATVIGYITLATMVSQTSGMDTRMRTSTTTAMAVLAAVGLSALFRARRNRGGPVEGAGGDQRQPEREARAFAKLTAHLQPSAVRLGDPFGNGKSKP